MADTPKNPDFDAVRKDIDELRADLAALGKDVRKLVRDGAGREAAAALGSLQDGAEAAIESVVGQGRDAVDSVGACVRNRPVESLLVAFGIGVVLGNVIRK